MFECNIGSKESLGGRPIASGPEWVGRGLRLMRRSNAAWGVARNIGTFKTDTGMPCRERRVMGLQRAWVNRWSVGLALLASGVMARTLARILAEVR